MAYGRSPRLFAIPCHSAPMKTIFITSFHPHISRNILATAAFRILASRADLRVIVLVPDYKADYFKEKFGGGNVVIEGVKPHRASATLRGLFLKKLAVFFFHTDTARARKRYEYFCEGKYGYYLVSRAAGFLARSSLVRRAIRSVDYRFSPKGFFSHLYDRYRPDLIFSTDVQNENDTSILQDARRRGIPTAGMIRSWDNPTQRAIRIFPDILFVGSDTLKEEAVVYSGYPANRVTVVGNPHYDRYLLGPSVTREKFFSQFGLDPSRRTILYAPVGDHLLKRNDVDEYVMNILADTGEQVLVRFPPDEGVRLVNFVKPPQMGYDRPGLGFAPSSFSDREITPEDDQRLIDSLFYCAMAITGPTSIPLDAALMGKPSVMINFYPAPRAFCGAIFNYWYSHIRKLLSVGGVRCVRSREELLKAIGDYFRDPSQDEAGRKKMRSLWFSYADGHAGERLAGEILSLLGLR